MKISERRDIIRFFAVVSVGFFFPKATTADDALTFHAGFISDGILGQGSTYGAGSSVWIDGQYRFELGPVEGGVHAKYETLEETLFYDGSYVQLPFGDWVAGVGLKDRHWSLSPNTSLILSDNAAPLPTIYLTKSDRSPFQSPILAWIGPWEADFFFGYNYKGDSFRDANMLGARVVIEPIKDFELEAVWTTQFFPDDADFRNIFGDETNAGISPDANGMAGFGVAYAWGANRIYAQAIGEDAAGLAPSCFMYLAGFSRQTVIGTVPSNLNFEVVDTRISETPNGWCGPGTAYRNGTHPYVQDGVVMGAPIDSEGVSVSVRGAHDLPDYDIDWSLGYDVVNDASIANHRLSSQRVDGLSAHLGLGFDYHGTRVVSRVHYNGYELDRTAVDEGLVLSIELSKSF
ncbi:capsule assembly Wzi family protein [Salibaculum griseiflavum]|uniref:Aldo/keto reductase n=1 Tax=Salibaculum griseiflavum TaxID=1914409 RepID=A0A2V1P1G5_9RHOB|nr:capsule assembly Wzi family protein [Salibaculum griseiflavum]PWG16166.1 aldo/keto reductase [Salibaculum griseiflavum]